MNIGLIVNMKIKCTARPRVKGKGAISNLWEFVRNVWRKVFCNFFSFTFFPLMNLYVTCARNRSYLHNARQMVLRDSIICTTWIRTERKWMSDVWTFDCHWRSSRFKYLQIIIKNYLQIICLFPCSYIERETCVCGKGNNPSEQNYNCWFNFELWIIPILVLASRLKIHLFIKTMQMYVETHKILLTEPL